MLTVKYIIVAKLNCLKNITSGTAANPMRLARSLRKGKQVF